MIHSFENVRFFFGDASTQVDGKALIESYDQAVESRNQIESLASEFGASDLFFLHQTHASYGSAIEESNRSEFVSFASQGDFLITQCKNLGIGVLTADCAPVLIYEPKTLAIAAVHAGWKGAVNSVVANACQQMKQVHGSGYSDLRIWIGPCARACCYQVSSDFINQIPTEYTQHITTRGGMLYFDLIGCIEHQLFLLGVGQHQIDSNPAKCTLHTTQYCSSRRSNRSSARQMSAITIQAFRP